MRVLEARLDVDRDGAHVVGVGEQRLTVDVVPRLDVLVERRRRPAGVLHEEVQLVLAAVGRHRGEVDLLDAATSAPGASPWRSRRAGRRRPRGTSPAGRRSATRRASRSHAAPSRTPVIVTTLYDGPLPWAWFMYQSRRASSPSASNGIHPSRNAASNSSSLAPATSCTSWTNSIRRHLPTAGTATTSAVRSSLLSQRSRNASASCIQVPGARISAGMSVVSRPSRRSGSRMRCMSVTSRLRVRPERGLEAGFDLQEPRRARVAVLERRRVDAARRVDVVEELALERPHGVLHVHRPARARRRRWARRRGRGRPWATTATATSTLPCTSWRKVSSSRDPLLQVARLDAPAQALPRRAVAHRGDGDDLVRPAAAVGVVQVPEQAGVVAVGQCGHPAPPERVLERVLVVAGDLVGLVEEEHGRILARTRGQWAVFATCCPGSSFTISAASEPDDRAVPVGARRHEHRREARRAASG